jgi:hypothetical protein
VSLGDGENFEEVSGLAERRVRAENGAKIRQHEVVFSWIGHDLTIVVAVWGPDEHLAFRGDVGTIARFLIIVGDAEANLGEGGGPERNVLNGVEAGECSRSGTMWVAVEFGQAVGAEVIEHGSCWLTMGTDGDAAFSINRASGTIDEVGSTVNVGVGNGRLQKESVFFVEDGVGVGLRDGGSINFKRLND